jgi:hypothetical protein
MISFLIERDWTYKVNDTKIGFLEASLIAEYLGFDTPYKMVCYYESKYGLPFRTNLEMKKEDLK